MGGNLRVTLGGATMASGSLNLPSGGISVTSGTVAPADFYASSTSFTGNVLLGSYGSTTTGTVASFSEGPNTLLKVKCLSVAHPPSYNTLPRRVTLCPQVLPNGFVSMGRLGAFVGAASIGAGTTLTTSGLAVTSSGLTVTAGPISIVGSSAVAAGSLSVTSAVSPDGILDVLAAATTGNSNVLQGYLPAAATGMLMQFTTGAASIFTVRVLISPALTAAAFLSSPCVAGQRQRCDHREQRNHCCQRLHWSKFGADNCGGHHPDRWKFPSHGASVHRVHCDLHCSAGRLLLCWSRAEWQRACYGHRHLAPGGHKHPVPSACMRFVPCGVVSLA